MDEKEIESYMKQYNVDRETAIKEITEILEEYYEEQEKAMQEVYEDIIRGLH